MMPRLLLIFCAASVTTLMPWASPATADEAAAPSPPVATAADVTTAEPLAEPGFREGHDRRDRPGKNDASSDAGPDRPGNTRVPGVPGGPGESENRDAGEGPGSPRGGWFGGGRMDEEELGRARAVLQEVYPDLATRMEALYASDPEQARRTLERRFPRVRFLVKLQQFDPAMYDLRVSDLRLERHTQQTAQQLSALPDDAPQREALQATLRTQVAEHFDVRQAIRQQEIESLARRLDEMRQRLDDRAAARNTEIESRLAELLTPE